MPSEARKIKFIFKNNTNINELTINDNFITNLQGNININKLNLSSTSALKLLLCSHITLADDGGTNSLNIGSEEYEEIERIFLTIGTMTAKYDYTDQKVHYDYEDIVCGNCSAAIANITNSTTDNNAILDSIEPCSTCKKSFNMLTISNIKAYLYPRYIYLNSKNFNLYCSICQGNNNGGLLMYCKFSFENNQFSNLSLKRDHRTEHKNCILTNNDEEHLIYDPKYVLEQLNKYLETFR